MIDKSALGDEESVGKLGLKNGEMLYAKGLVKAEGSEKEDKDKDVPPPVEEDEVDVLLDKEDGWIKQSHSRYCQHKPNGSCLHCISVAPWNIQEVEPWKTEKLKHIPFTSWLRQRDEGRGECRHTKSPGEKRKSERKRKRRMILFYRDILSELSSTVRTVLHCQEVRQT